MSLIQIDSPFLVKTPLGNGYLIFLESSTSDYWWTVALSNGAIVTFTQDKIRMARSYSHDRGIKDKEMSLIISRK